MSKGDEDSTDQYLDALGKKASETYCQQWYTNDKGKRVRCTRKKHKFGKHK